MQVLTEQSRVYTTRHRPYRPGGSTAPVQEALKYLFWCYRVVDIGSPNRMRVNLLSRYMKDLIDSG